MSKSTESWNCETCQGLDLPDREAVLEHLKTVHGETGENPKGTKRMLSHIDGRDWFGGTDQWTFECGAVIIRGYRVTRSEDDPMWLLD